jgi:hypothetical protein
VAEKEIQETEKRHRELEEGRILMEHFVSASCGGEHCRVCGDPATHKVGEEIMHDDPSHESLYTARHNFTAYVCCDCFTMIMGPAVPCEK